MVEQSTARDYALHQLAELGHSAGQALPAIVSILQDERPLVRYLAAPKRSSRWDRSRRRHCPALKQQLHDADPVVRASIADALTAIESENTAVTEPATKVLGQ